MIMYRYELFKGDELECLLADDFSAPAEMNTVALEDTVIRELNKKVAGKTYEEYNKFGNVIDYSVKVYAHVIRDTTQLNIAWVAPPAMFPIYLVGPSEFHKKPELNYNVA
jgi:hypothetical protein